mgnify:CR=1 FL=1
MLNIIYKRKLEDLMLLLVPAIFTSKQFNVLIKRLENKKLSQTERNYLSNSIKSKLKAILEIKHLNFFQIYFRKNKKKILNSVVYSYLKSGINLFGYENIKGKAISATEAVKSVLNNYQELDARIVDLLPVYVLKNKGKINLFEIYDFAVENSLVNFTGYVFGIVQKHSYCKEFKNFLAALENRKDGFYIARDERYLKIIDFIEQDDISRKWNIITLNKEKDYGKYFELYA